MVFLEKIVFFIVIIEEIRAKNIRKEAVFFAKKTEEIVVFWCEFMIFIREFEASIRKNSQISRSSEEFHKEISEISSKRVIFSKFVEKIDSFEDFSKEITEELW